MGGRGGGGGGGGAAGGAAAGGGGEAAGGLPTEVTPLTGRMIAEDVIERVSAAPPTGTRAEDFYNNGGAVFVGNERVRSPYMAMVQTRRSNTDEVTVTEGVPAFRNQDGTYSRPGGLSTIPAPRAFSGPTAVADAQAHVAARTRFHGERLARERARLARAGR